MATTERRPRINFMTADLIDALRDDVPFEGYVNDVLERHTKHMIGQSEHENVEQGRRSLVQLEDGRGAVVYVDGIDTDVMTHAPEGTLGWIVCDDEDYDAVGVFLNLRDARALRDALTELIDAA